MRSVMAYAALAALSVVAIALQGLRADAGIIDDAYISARYAEHFALGNEFSFNWGSRVEGYTNFLWVLLAGTLAKLGLPAAEGVFLLSLLAGCAGIVLLGDFFLRELNLPPWGAIVAAAGLGCLTPWAAWAWSGMETCGFGVLWFASLWAYARGRRPVGWAASGALAALTGMVRPEGVLVVAVMALHGLVVERNRRKLLTAIGTFAALFGAYFAWRWAYFGDLLPNTYHAKVGGPSGELAMRGWGYLWNFLVGSAPLCVGVLLAAVLRSTCRDRPVLCTMGLGMAVHATFGVVAVGGDHFAMYRFCTPLLPAMVAVSWAGAADLSSRLAGPRVSASGVLAAGSVCTLLLCILADQTLLSASMPGQTGGSHLERFRCEVRDARTWREIGLCLGKEYGPEGSVATFAIGAIGYFSKMTVWDMHGLIHRQIARKAIPTGSGYAGHEKYDSEFILRQDPDAILLINQLFLDDSPPRLDGWLWGEASKDLAQQAEFTRNYGPRALRTRWGRFVAVHERVRHGPTIPKSL